MKRHWMFIAAAVALAAVVAPTIANAQDTETKQFANVEITSVDAENRTIVVKDAGKEYKITLDPRGAFEKRVLLTIDEIPEGRRAYCYGKLNADQTEIEANGLIVTRKNFKMGDKLSANELRGEPVVKDGEVFMKVKDKMIKVIPPPKPERLYMNVELQPSELKPGDRVICKGEKKDGGYYVRWGIVVIPKEK